MSEAIASKIIRRFLDGWKIDRRNGALVWLKPGAAFAEPLTDAELLYLRRITGDSSYDHTSAADKMASGG